jgi:hypothetical protein
MSEYDTRREEYRRLVAEATQNRGSLPTHASEPLTMGLRMTEHRVALILRAILVLRSSEYTLDQQLADELLEEFEIDYE